MKWIFVFLMALASVATAQNVAVRQFSDDPASEFNLVAGCPPAWPTVVDRIGTNSVSPFASRLVMTEAELRNLYAANGPAFTNWYQGVYLPAVRARDDQTRTNQLQNVQALINLFDAFEAYETLAATGTPSNAQVLLETRRLNAAFLRLRPVLRDLYRGD